MVIVVPPVAGPLDGLTAVIAGGGAVTVTVAVLVRVVVVSPVPLPVPDTVMTAVPALSAVTIPEAATEATAGEAELNVKVTDAPVAAVGWGTRVTVSPTCSAGAPGLTASAVRASTGAGEVLSPPQPANREVAKVRATRRGDRYRVLDRYTKSLF